MQTIDSHRVETNMIALGQTVRYQPVDTLPTGELLARMEGIVGQLYGLAAFSDIEVGSHMTFKYRHAATKVNPARVLATLACMEYELRRLYHTYGLAQYAPIALDEHHVEEMSKIWPDGKLRIEEDGSLDLPPTYQPADMEKILKTYPTQPTLFEDPKPTKVIQDKS